MEREKRECQFFHQNSASGNPPLSRGGRKEAFLVWGKGGVASLASPLSFLFCDQPGAKCHPGQDSTLLDLCSLCESLVPTIGMQTDAMAFAVIAPDGTESIRGVPDYRPSLQAKGTRASIRLTYPAFGRLQAVQLPSMEGSRHHVPQVSTAWFCCSTDGCCQHPGIYRMGVERLLALAFRLLETVLFPHLFGLPTFPQVHDQTHLTQEPVEMLFTHLDRAEGRIPLASLSFPSHRLHILHHGIGEWHDLLEMGDDPRPGFPAAPCRGWYPVLAVDPIVKAFRASPFASSTCTAHGAACLDGLFDMRGSFDHQVGRGGFGPDHAEAFKLAPWINANDKRLIVRLLFVDELDREQPQFVSLWPG